MNGLDDLGMNPEPLVASLVKADYDLIANLRRARMARGLSVHEVANRLGVSVNTVNKFESIGSDPNLSSIRRYAAVINVGVTHDVRHWEAHRLASSRSEVADTPPSLREE